MTAPLLRSNGCGLKGLDEGVADQPSEEGKKDDSQDKGNDVRVTGRAARRLVVVGVVSAFFKLVIEQRGACDEVLIHLLRVVVSAGHVTENVLLFHHYRLLRLDTVGSINP